MCAIPSTSWSSDHDALSSSVDIWTSFVNPKFTAQVLDLMLDLGEHGKVVGVDKDIPTVLGRRQQIESLLQLIFHPDWRLRSRDMHGK
jgi:hypothetical protein